MIREPTPEWTRLRQELPDLHSALERLAAEVYQRKTPLVPEAELGYSGADDGQLKRDGANVGFEGKDVAREYLARFAVGKIEQSWEDPKAFVAAFQEALHRSVTTGLDTKIGSTILHILAVERQKDILSRMSEVSRLALADESWRHRFWVLHSSFCEVLPELKPSASQLAAQFDPILRAESGDLAAGGPYRAIRRLAEQSADDARALVAAFLESAQDSVASLASDALIGLAANAFSKAQRLAQDLTSADRWIHRRVGVAALGGLPYPDKDSLKTTLEHLAHVESSSLGTEDVLVRAYGNLLRHDSAAAGQQLAQLARSLDGETRNQLAFVLFQSREEQAEEQWFQESLILLAPVDLSHRGTTTYINYCLEHLAHMHPKSVCRFLDRFVKCHPDLIGSTPRTSVVDLFEDSVDSLFEHQRSELQLLVTEWFHGGETLYHRQAAAIVEHFSERGERGANTSLSLDTGFLASLPLSEVLSTLSHALGFLYDARSLTQLLLSAVERDPVPSELAKFVENALASYVLYNYPEGARAVIVQWLARARGDSTGATVAKNALSHLDAYQRQREQLPDAKELEPPGWRRERFRRVVLKHRSEELGRAVEERSVLLQLVTRISVKYGRAMFTDQEGNLSDPLQMAPMSHSVEMPRGEIIDPLGQMYRRYLWQRAGASPSRKPGKDTGSPCD